MAGNTASTVHGPELPAGSGRAAAGHRIAPRADSLFHGVLLATAACVLLLSCVLSVDGGERVRLPILGEPLPGICTYKWLFGVGCPGCGLTRSFISLAHGDPSAAWHFNPAGVLLFAVVVAQLPYRLGQIWRIRRGLSEWRWPVVAHVGFWACFGGLMAQWLWRTFV